MEMNAERANLSDKYRKVLDMAERDLHIKLSFIASLGGGHSGASLYLADVLPEQGNISRRVILKFDHFSKKKNEDVNHKLATRSYSDSFTKNHLVAMAYAPYIVKSEDTIILFYEVAGASLIEYRPLRVHESSSRNLSSTLMVLASDLLTEWNVNAKYSELMSSTDIVKHLFLSRFSLNFDRLQKFLENYGIELGDNLIVDEKVLPNPLSLVCGNLPNLADRRLRFPLGAQHSDLNAGNILVKSLLTPDATLEYYLIDFLHFREDGCCLFDLLTLELGVIIDFIERTGISPLQIKQDIMELASPLPENSNFSTEFSGIASTLIAFRNKLDQFINQKTDAYRDDWRLSLCLCGIAVGLIGANIPSIENEIRILSFLYAASFFQAYCKAAAVQINLNSQAKSFPTRVTALSKVDSNFSSWRTLLSECNSFESDNIYIGVFGNDLNFALKNLSLFGRIPWSAVIDFDVNSDNEGHLLHSVEPELNQKRFIHRLTSSVAIPTLHLDRACYWYSPMGFVLEDKDNNVDWMEWNSLQSPKLEKFIEVISKNTTKPITILIFWDNSEFVDDIARIASRFFYRRVKFLWINPNLENSDRTVNRYAMKVHKLDFLTVLEGISVSLPGSQNNKDEIVLPCFIGETESRLFRPIPLRTFNWIEEECDLLHTNLGHTEINQGIQDSYFLRGRKITWFELSVHDDVDRDITPRLQKRIDNLLAERATASVELIHYPGAGGTTIAYRVAWEIHWSYPVLIARSVSVTTIERIQDIYKFTQLPILFVIDSAVVTSGEIERLKNQILARKTPVILLIVRREFSLPKETEYLFPLPQELNNRESFRFASILSTAVPSKQFIFDDIVKNQNNVKMRTPFYFGLIAFEQNFLGLENFVSTRLTGLSELEQKIITIISMIYSFAQQNVPPQLFSFLLRLPPSEPVNLRKHLQVSRMDLLIAEEDGWRPLHFFIAEEVLIQLLAGSKERSQWTELLPQYSINIIEWLGDLVKYQGLAITEQVKDLLQGLFIERRGQEISSSSSQLMERAKLSDLIEKIPSVTGKVIVFDKLVEIFPEESHYWAHRSRLISTYAKDVSDYESAIASIDRALSLESENHDYVLHHIRGMAFAKWATYLMENHKLNISYIQREDTEEMLQTINGLIETALSEFRSIYDEIRPTEERAYVWAIETITRYIEFAKSISDHQTFSELFRSPTAKQLVDYLSDAESLLDRLKRLHDGQGNVSRFAEEREYHLKKLYDDLGSYISGLWNLLARNDTYKPRYRRSLVYAYLAKNGRSWNNMSQKDLYTLQELMEDNLVAEPGNNQNIRLWFEASRRLPSVSINQAIQQLSEWVSNTKAYDALDAYYYLYIMHVLATLEGSVHSRTQAEIILEKCKMLAQDRTNRTFSFNWLGTGNGLIQLVNYMMLGKIGQDTQFYEDTSSLKRITGQIEKIDSRQSGRISAYGLSFFFTPTPRVGHQYVKERDELRKVKFYVGFSYDGLRAWNVEPA